MDKSHACAVCGRVLNHYTDLNTGEWKWQHSDVNEEDHPPVPVPTEEIPEQLKVRCDFCFADEVVWIVPAREIHFQTYPAHIQGGMDADWAACGVCGKLIDGNRWNSLLERVKVSWEERHGPMDSKVEAELRKLYRLLRANITGSLRRV